MIEIKNPESKKALIRILNLCSRQEKCSFDVDKKLIDWGIKTVEIEKIQHYLRENNFVDDERYARMFAREKATIYKWGKQKIRFQLQMKNIDSQTIDQALNSIDISDYESVIRKEIKKKMDSLKRKDITALNLKNKLYNFCMQRGYEIDVVKHIIDEMLNKVI
ncbi:MAG: RecX family transcriptional regulator [Bacteroidales bacterium]|nr:RecX family transcriptional regulator [Bacteroidales bacterium]